MIDIQAVPAVDRRLSSAACCTGGLAVTTIIRRRRGRQSRRTNQPNFLSRSVLRNSLRLAKCPVAAIGTIIVSTLEELSQIEGADQAGWFLLQEDRSVVRYVSVPTGEAVDRVGSLGRDDLPWCRARLLKGKSVLVTDLAELPLQAKIDRIYLEGLGVRSFAFVPAENGDLSSGVLALLSTRHVCRWSDLLSQSCALLGNVFLSAHARKLAYLGSESSDTYFREIFRSASVGMAVEDTSGRMLYVNDALCGMFGFTEPEMMRLSCKDFSHPADYEREAILFDQLISGERLSYQMEKRFLHRNGATVWGKVQVTLLRENPNGTRVVLGIVEDITAQKDALEKLTISQKEVQCLASRLILSQEDERSRIARELHDDIGQRLSLIASEIPLVKGRLVDGDRSQLTALDRLSGELDILASDVHGLSHRLHSAKLQHLGVAKALRDFCKQIAQSGLHVELKLDQKLEPVPRDIALCLYRIAQEALNNALKHSGANHAALTLLRTPDCYFMAVRDAGRGFDMSRLPQGLGLVSMQERLKPLQGHFDLTSSPGRGTQIVVRIPREGGAGHGVECA